MALVDLYKCGCMWEEQPNAVKDSPVKGYVKKTECAACKAKREADAANTAAAEEDRKEKIALAEKRQSALNVVADEKIAEVEKTNIEGLK